jgi:hypothetical protein
VNIAFSADDAQIVRPEVLLPVQFFGAVRKYASHQGGEHRLLVALLQDAVHCFRRYAFASDDRSRRLFAEAEQWIMKQDDPPTSKSFSFEYVCAVLDLDSGWLRHGLQSWMEDCRARLQRRRTAAVTPIRRRALGAAQFRTGENG